MQAHVVDKHEHASATFCAYGLRMLKGPSSFRMAQSVTREEVQCLTSSMGVIKGAFNRISRFDREEAVL